MRPHPARPRHPAPPERVRSRRAMTLQWHVTDRCNLRCSHCYQDSYVGEEMDLGDLLGVIGQFKELLSLPMFSRCGPPGRGHVNVTGGEPLVRGDLLDLLAALHREKGWLTYGLLTNGTRVDERTATELAALEPQMVQVSVEGTPATHDAIRGRGSHELAMRAIRHLSDSGIFTIVSFTAHRRNFREFPEVAKRAVRAGASKVWTDRLVPIGGGEGMAHLLLTQEETREFFGIVKRTRRRLERSPGGPVVPMDRGLQFLVGGGMPYRCSAGDTMLTVMPGGEVLPCRRLPVRVGDVREASLRHIYEDNALLGALRDRDRVPGGCEGCNFSRTCGGGARCQSYATTGDPFRSDPGCWLAGEGPLFACDCLERVEQDTIIASADLDEGG